MVDSLSPKQQKIYRELLKIDKKAAEAYNGALTVLRDRENSDRFSQSAHSLREITAIISRKVSIPQKAKKEEASLKKKLEKQFIEKLDLLPSPADEKTRTLIKEWGKVHKFFISVSHHRKDVNEEEFSSKLSEFEAILLQFLKPVPVTLGELDSLLSIQSPTQDDTKRLSELLTHPTHVEYFFSRLIWPSWLTLLKEDGFFSKPPESISEDGYIMFPAWSLSKYLIKVAGEKPREVMDIIKSMKETDNFGVHIGLINCALQMPSLVAKEIVPLAKKWMATPYQNLIPEELGKLCTKLINENEVESALDLLGVLLDVRSPNGEIKVSLKEAQPHFDLWWYEQILNKVVFVVLEKEPYNVIEILCSSLSKAIKLERPDEGSFYNDLSHIWRPAIENHSQNMDDRDVKSLLVTTIRKSLETIGKGDEKIFQNCYQSLSKFNYPIFRRIELHLMRLFPDLLGSEIQNVLSQKKVFKDICLWHEYYHLIGEQYSKLPQHLKENILKWIEEGPDFKRFESWYKAKGKTLPTQEEKDAYKANWQMSYLSALKDVVPPEWKEKWNELVAKYEEPNHPDFHFYTEPVRIGSTSPLTKEEIKKRAPQEVANYLRTWKPSKDFSAPSMEGLGRILSEVISEDPSNYVKVCPDFKTLHHVYIYNLIYGFREAVKKGSVFDWSPVILFCNDILTTSETDEIHADEANLYDWRSVKGAIADLLKEGLKNKTMSLPFELRETAWRIIESLLHNPEPDLIFEGKYGGKNMDPFTLSLNTVRGKAMHVLIQYSLWNVRCLNLSEKEDRMVPEVKEQLEKMLDPKHEPTKTIRSIYGAYFPNLFYLNKGWTKEHIPSIFPKDAEHRMLWRAAWEAYIKYCRPYKAVYEMLRDEYQLAIQKLDSPKISKVAKEKLSVHVMIAYLRKQEGLGDKSLTKLFFQKAQPEIRGHAIWFFGRKLKDLPKWKVDKENKERIIKRIMDLWEWRIEEVKKVDDQARKEFVQEFKSFGLWFVHSPFNKMWAISQLYQTLELTEGATEFAFAHDVVDNLQNYVEEHYLDVLRTLLLLVKGDSKVWLLRSSIEKITELLEFIIRECPHQEIKDSVNELVDGLTKRGYHDFAKFFLK